MRRTYTPSREWCVHAHGIYRTYGMRCFYAYRGRKKLVCVFHDVTTDPLFAVRLAYLCTKEQVELCHFRDIVYDLTDLSPPKIP